MALRRALKITEEADIRIGEGILASGDKRVEARVVDTSLFLALALTCRSPGLGGEHGRGRTKIERH